MMITTDAYLFKIVVLVSLRDAGFESRYGLAVSLDIELDLSPPPADAAADHAQFRFSDLTRVGGRVMWRTATADFHAVNTDTLNNSSLHGHNNTCYLIRISCADKTCILCNGAVFNRYPIIRASKSGKDTTILVDNNNSSNRL